jgi:RNA polymerase sigma-70 factor (ECF subfamily)
MDGTRAAEAGSAEAETQGSIDPKVRIEEVFARHQGELLGLLFHVVGQMEDAQDALQEAFLKCWQHRHQIGEISSLKAWVYRIVLNTGRDVRQTAWRRRRRSIGDDMAGSLPDKHPEPGEATIRQEEVALVRRAVSDLRAEEKEVFLLRENGSFTYEEIGQLLGIPVGTVKTRMRSALAQLQAVLRPRPT